MVATVDVAKKIAAGNDQFGLPVELIVVELGGKADVITYLND